MDRLETDVAVIKRVVIPSTSTIVPSSSAPPPPLPLPLNDQQPPNDPNMHPLFHVTPSIKDTHLHDIAPPSPPPITSTSFNNVKKGEDISSVDFLIEEETRVSTEEKPKCFLDHGFLGNSIQAHALPISIVFSFGFYVERGHRLKGSHISIVTLTLVTTNP